MHTLDPSLPFLSSNSHIPVILLSFLIRWKWRNGLKFKIKYHQELGKVKRKLEKKKRKNFLICSVPLKLLLKCFPLKNCLYHVLPSGFLSTSDFATHKSQPLHIFFIHIRSLLRIQSPRDWGVFCLNPRSRSSLSPSPSQEDRLCLRFVD